MIMKIKIAAIAKRFYASSSNIYLLLIKLQLNLIIRPHYSHKDNINFVLKITFQDLHYMLNKQ